MWIWLKSTTYVNSVLMQRFCEGFCVQIILAGKVKTNISILCVRECVHLLVFVSTQWKEHICACRENIPKKRQKLTQERTLLQTPQNDSEAMKFPCAKRLHVIPSIVTISSIIPFETALHITRRGCWFWLSQDVETRGVARDSWCSPVARAPSILGRKISCNDIVQRLEQTIKNTLFLAKHIASNMHR